MAPEELRSARYAADPDEGGIFRRILDVAADAIVTVDEAQNIVHFNQGAERMFGYQASEVIGRPLNLLLPTRFRAAHPGFVKNFGESAETARLMGHRREVYGLRSNGREFPAEASILKLEQAGGGRVYTAVVRDVTDRKRLDEQQRFLASVSASLSDSLDYESTLHTVVQLAVPLLADTCILDVVTEAGDLRRVTSDPADGPDAEGLRRALAELRDRFTPTWNSPSSVVDVLRTTQPDLVSEVTDEWLEAHCENADEIALLRRIGTHSLIIAPLV
ncbi:MAG TPA: PAS domain S-box protein, partial [Candidatus Elarobacter sp.]|nr:PAS domain S-box protein [Candidatus Elarobacter sp.]